MHSVPVDLYDSLFVSLLSAARGGSSESLGQLLEAFRHYLNVIAESELDGDLQAKVGRSDLVQQTFLEAHAAFGSFGGKSHEEFRAWLRAILLNNVQNVRRDFRDVKKREVARERPLASDDSSHCAAEPPGPDRSPSQFAMLQEDAARLEQALARLPEHYRQIVVLHHRDELTFEEAGQRMQRSAEAARKLWVRAIEQLVLELKAVNGAGNESDTDGRLAGDV